jgi:hypothetical protein
MAPPTRVALAVASVSILHTDEGGQACRGGWNQGIVWMASNSIGCTMILPPLAEWRSIECAISASLRVELRGESKDCSSVPCPSDISVLVG